jgi:hypothetical protein
MSKKRELTDADAKAWWKALGAADRRFFRALLGVGNVIGDPSLHYAEPPPHLCRRLEKADRNTQFSVIAECLYLLLDAPAMEIVKRHHRRRKRRAARANAAPAPSLVAGATGRRRPPAGAGAKT